MAEFTVSELNQENITNLYLYGKLNKPTNLVDDNLIREPDDDDPSTAQTTVNVDAVRLMETGPGRFAVPAQFELVQKFFDPNFNPTPGEYLSVSKSVLNQSYFNLFGISWEMRQLNYDDGRDNLTERAYIWNNMSFQIANDSDIKFVIEPDGTKKIENFRAYPRLDNPDNFDFTSQGIGGIIANVFLEPNIDPSGIGRTVNINFDNIDGIEPIDVYTENDFYQDLKPSQITEGSVADLFTDEDIETKYFINLATAGSRIFPERNEFVGELFEQGITRFIDGNDKPILYGTVNNDNLKASNLGASNFPLLVDKAKNGVVLVGGQGNDTIQGDVNGNVSPTDDILVGHEGNDNLDGRGGEDLAIFSDIFDNYEIETTGTFTKTTTITHKDGGVDGVDTLKNIEFGIFGEGEPIPLANSNSGAATNSNNASEEARIIPLPLEDGVEDTEFVEVTSTVANPNPNDPPTPPYISLTTPVDMLDGDIEYTVNISPYKPDTQHNVVYILDTSLSIDAAELQTMKDAYTDLTNFYINEGIAEDINFGVVSYDTSGRFHLDSSGDKNLTADEAISAIDTLTTSNGVGTDYDAGLWNGVSFLTTSPFRPSFPVSPGGSSSFSNPDGTTSIAYFFTDGQNSSDRFTMLNTAATLRRYSNVQAIGYYPELDTLTSDSLKIRDVNWVDSNQGVFIDNQSDLSTELLKSDLADDVVEVNILLDGQVIETLTPDQFTDSPLGLTYSGTAENEEEIEELDVSVDAENIITAEVVFTSESNFATTTVEQTVTAGKGEVVDENGDPIDESGNEDVDPFERVRSGGDGDDDITLGYVDLGANGGAGGDYIVGNRRNNILDGGEGNDTILGHEGNDTIITGMGINEVDGGEDIDTVLYSDVVYENNGSLSFGHSGTSLIYLDGDNAPHTDSLTNIEYLQFSDVRISAETLEVTPTIEEISDASLIEGETASFSFNLDYPAPVDITFDYSTEDIDATAGDDYTATSGQITIPAGDTTATIDIVTNEDTAYDESTEAFNLNLTGLTGATFSNDETELSVAGYIENIEADITTVGTGEDDFITGGSGNDSLQGNNGNDFIEGEAGNDTLRGNNGNDYLDGGEGDDSLFGNAGDDTVIGGTGNDTLVHSVNANMTLTDTELISDGTDIIQSVEFITLTGGTGNNVINASEVTQINTTIKSLGGNDLVRGGEGVDSIVGGAGNDTILGDLGNDIIRGDIGNDTIIGGPGNDTLFGAAGDDSIIGGSGIDILVEGGDVDFTLTDNSLVGNGTDSLTAIQEVRLTGGNSNNLIDASATTIINRTVLAGGNGNDTLIGGAKQDTLKGNDGNDLLEGGDLRDVMFGGNDNDTLMGMNGNDILRGEGGNDILMGMNDNDILKGEAGDDTLVGGEGRDLLTGGAGADVFAIEVMDVKDIILDFEDGVDYFSLGSGTSFEDLKITGNAAGTTSAIRLDSNNQVLAVMRNVDYNDITAEDFI